MQSGAKTLSVGKRIDRYEVRELIGRGGMGAVYRAIDTRLGRTVALKTVLAGGLTAAATEELRRRFMREALAASKVEHRNVIQVIDFGIADGETPYLVMEYLRADLGTVLKRSPGFLPPGEVVDIMLGMCAAVSACHRVGIIHRDLKPANIFLSDTDTGWEVKVLDFGVSKAGLAFDMTQEGRSSARPVPLTRADRGHVVPASDQYAVGVLLYVCLTNRPPYEEHESLPLLRAIAVGRFAAPQTHRPDLPEALEAIVLRAMHVAPTALRVGARARRQIWKFASPRGRDTWRTLSSTGVPRRRPWIHRCAGSG